MWILVASLAGALSTAIALWRMQLWKGRAETRAEEIDGFRELVKSLGEEIADLDARDDAREAEVSKLQLGHQREVARLNGVITDLRAQRKKALDALDRCSAPGALRDILRSSLGVPDGAHGTGKADPGSSGT